MAIFPKSPSGTRVPRYNLLVPNIWSYSQNHHQILGYPGTTYKYLIYGHFPKIIIRYQGTPVLPINTYLSYTPAPIWPFGQNEHPHCINDRHTRDQMLSIDSQKSNKGTGLTNNVNFVILTI